MNSLSIFFCLLLGSNVLGMEPESNVQQEQVAFTFGRYEQKWKVGERLWVPMIVASLIVMASEWSH